MFDRVNPATSGAKPPLPATPRHATRTPSQSPSAQQRPRRACFVRCSRNSSAPQPTSPPRCFTVARCFDSLEHALVAVVQTYLELAQASKVFTREEGREADVLSELAKEHLWEKPIRVVQEAKPGSIFYSY